MLKIFVLLFKTIQKS